MKHKIYFWLGNCYVGGVLYGVDYNWIKKNYGTIKKFRNNDYYNSTRFGLGGKHSCQFNRDIVKKLGKRQGKIITLEIK